MYDLASITGLPTKSFDNLLEEKNYLRSSFFQLPLPSFSITSCFRPTLLLWSKTAISGRVFIVLKSSSWLLVAYAFIKKWNTSRLPVWYGSTKWTMSFKILGSSIIFSMQSSATLFFIHPLLFEWLLLRILFMVTFRILRKMRSKLMLTSNME